MMAAVLQIIRSRQNNLSVVFSHSTPHRADVDPVFCTNRRNYPREKIAKNATHSRSSSLYQPLPSSLFPVLLFILSFPFQCRRTAKANTHNDTSFGGDSYSSCYSSFIGTNITDTGYKAAVTTGQEC